MKTIKILSVLFLCGVVATSCSNDDDNPAPVNEEELITTLTVTLTPNGGGATVTMQSQDLDGDGPNAPTITISGDLAANTSYNGSIVLLNETVNPADNITSEVEAEAEAHQFFYTIGGGLDATTSYDNFDSNSNPLGTQFTLTTAAASTGSITFTLRHEPMKPNTGLGDAGGETDIAVTFNNVVIQ